MSSAQGESRPQGAGKPDWRDCLIALALVGVGAAVLFRLLPIPHPGRAWIFNDASHAWMLLIALFWLLVLRRKFPVGRLSPGGMKGWYRIWLVWAALVVLMVFSQPRHPHPALSVANLAGTLTFQGILVGPSEEFLCRGLIQTSLNNVPRLGSTTIPIARARVRLGTVSAALIFGLLHLSGLLQHPLSFVLPTAIFAFVFGLVAGQYYDHTGNLWGASILHDISDFIAVGLPLLF